MTKILSYLKSTLLPCLCFSALAGIGTGLLIFLFKAASSYVISLSEDAFAFVRNNPIFLPVLLIASALIALIASLILKREPNCRGGGIPTAIATLRALIPLSWIKGSFLLFGSAMLTYLGGVPLGNEGPSVQMGTAVGRGVVRTFAKKAPAWDRYIMTGGACAGFAAATGAPITGIFFAFEEAHRRFSPMIFMVASVSVIFGTTTMKFLCEAFGISFSIFSFGIDHILPTQYLWAPLAVGIVCGICAIFFTKVYTFIRKLLSEKLSRIPLMAKVIAVFIIVALMGFASAEFVGSGHHIIEELVHTSGIWYMTFIFLCVRAILLITANNIGITGGVFVPTLAFGAMIGSLSGDALVSMGILPKEYYGIMVITGIASFLGAASKTPITAITFAGEALCGLTNILPVTVGVTVAYLAVEAMGVTAFNDVILESKVEAAQEGKTPQIFDRRIKVEPDSFLVGKEIRDILWPPTCVVLSVSKAPDAPHTSAISEGDILHVHYLTYDTERTDKTFEALAGEQERDPQMKIHEGSDDHHVPET